MANDSEAALQASRAALNASLADTNTNGPAPVSEPNAPNSPPVIEQFERLAPPSANSADEGAQEREESLEPGEIAEVDMESQANGIRTVFSDPKNFNVKHPLYSSWTLWFDSPATKGRNMPQTPSTTVPSTPVPQTPGGAHSWMDDIKKVISFDSVEEFWGLWNHIVPPSDLPQKANYYLFREGIIPAWEDDANKNGGKWSIQLPRDKTRPKINDFWLHTLLAAIGETFDPELSVPVVAGTPRPQSIITGVIASMRPQFFRISIWTRLAPGEGDDALRQRIETIGRFFKADVLGYKPDAKLAGNLATDVEFLSHKDSEKKGKAAKKIIV